MLRTEAEVVGDGGFLRFALLVVLFGFDTMFTPGYFFRFVHTAFSLLKKRYK